MKSTITPTNTVVSSLRPVFFEKDLFGRPNFVNISIAIKCMVVLPVGITRKETSYKGDYWICIPTIFGNIRVADVVEFLEMSHLLGALHFMTTISLTEQGRCLVTTKEKGSTSSSLEFIHLYHSPRGPLPRANFFHARLLVPINKSSQLRFVQRFGRVYNPASEWKYAFSSLQYPRLYLLRPLFYKREVSHCR